MGIDHNMKILVVDDLPTMRHVILQTLHAIGLKNTTEAGDGLQALAELKKSKYDLLITDWNMPNMDGITLIRMMRGNEELKNIVVMMVTAEADKAHIVQAMKVGLSDYIVKPFTPDILQAKIEKYFSRKLESQ